MKIIIDDRYYVEVEDRSFNLHYVFPQKKDPTKTTDTVLGYYSGVQSVIKGCIQHKLSREDTTVGLDEFMVKWKAYNESMSNLFTNYNIP